MVDRAPDRKRQGAVAKGVFLGFFLTEYVLSLQKIRWTSPSNLKGREVVELVVTLISLGQHRRIINYYHYYPLFRNIPRDDQNIALINNQNVRRVQILIIDRRIYCETEESAKKTETDNNTSCETYIIDVQQASLYQYCQDCKVRPNANTRNNLNTCRKSYR